MLKLLFLWAAVFSAAYAAWGPPITTEDEGGVPLPIVIAGLWIIAMEIRDRRRGLW